MKKVSVIGAGNGGLTAAYHLSKIGNSVCVYDSPMFDTQINAINEKGGIEALEELHECKMLFSGFEKITKATTDIKEAVEFSDVLVLICPSFAQEILFEKMLPHLKDDQIIILMPGNYGGLVLNKIKNDSARSDLKLTFVDAISIPWACRAVEPAKIAIMGLKEFLPMSVFPYSNLEYAKSKIDNILPLRLEFLDNPIVAGLENINFGGHPLLTTLNMGLLENFNGEFNYYRDCCSVATANAAAKMDEERLSVGAQFGFDLKTELEAMNALYNSNYKTVYEFNRASTTHVKINSSPASSKSRYITEDVAYLLVPCFELAKVAGLNIPIVESCIHIASAYNDENYFKSGRTLETMGLDNMNVEEIVKYLSC
ncbi:opine dehydrogenase [Peptoclostridium litorale DSM 5388]|uniref:Opine dehydrogenase Odh n=1 Tax=Peptoclostridium litorale DSM 5388 TaxID=1121324 RepID=A0A069RAC8_PEPLI|nr:NAD/NADP-dependent octopine/nopaline dehydrogenase family protein [Peptoclostridium litorale]KDR94001.1 opine dehydrogenase Odh [Peptoclostridium litorale DSM 5388]SIN79377.1 opine dehydrogenase [Peptoclostridium litorale DSM 5388]